MRRWICVKAWITNICAWRWQTQQHAPLLRPAPVEAGHRQRTDPRRVDNLRLRPMKYESDGGPGIAAIMTFLLGSSEALKDRYDFMKP
jgi:hypothetical protein